MLEIQGRTYNYIGDILSRFRTSPRAVLALVFLLSLSLFLMVELLQQTLYRRFDAATYLVFHNIAEFFSIIVSLSIFSVGWYTYSQSKNKHSLFLSCSFLAIGLIDFMHTLSFPGMPDFITPGSTNKAILFWISARLFSAAAFLASAYIYADAKNRLLSKYSLLASSFTIVALVFAGAIYYPSYIPPMFIEGAGLTNLKIYLEYITVGLFTAAFFVYLKLHLKTGNTVHILFLSALIISVFSELAFTLYKSAFDTYNLLGHIYKIVAFYLIYCGVFIESVQRPYVKLKKTGEELRKVNRAYRVLSTCNQTLIHATEESGLLHEICKRIVEVGGYRFAWVGFAELDEKKIVRPAAQAGYEEGYLGNANITWADNERNRGPTGTAIRTGKPCVAKNILADPNYIPWRVEAIKRGYASAIALPLIADDKPFGALNIYATEPDAFDTEEIALLTELADDLAYGITALRLHAERKKAEEMQRKLASAVENTADIVIITNMDGIIEYVNPAFEKLTGYASDETIGNTPRILKSGKQDNKFYERLWGIILSGRVFRGELINREKNGELYYVEKTITPLKDELGNITKFVSVDKDITERKKAEETRLENLRLAAADKAKSEFLANMSHELRTPLNSIIGFSEILKGGLAGKLEEKQEHFIDNIFTSGTFLLSLINDILDLSKIEADKIELVPEKMSVPVTIKETLTLLKEKASKHNILLKAEIDPELEFIEADKQRFKQILFNLLSNAVKFSKVEGGTVTITAKKEGDMAKVSVSDTGIGIRKENIGKLFHKFEQLESGICQKYGGTGLGLAITKQLVELHGGRIWAESRFGEGSTFTFMLPLNAKGTK